MEKRKLKGYRREDGRYGIRNLVAVLAAADNVNPLARRLAAAVPGVISLQASYGRGQLGEDFELALRTMAGLAAHPNVAGCLVVSFEPQSAQRIKKRALELGRSPKTLSLLEQGGLTASLRRGSVMLKEMLKESARLRREPFGLPDLQVGSECGGSDTTSGLVSNPTLGWVVDWLVEAGATAIFSEPVECLGCEDLLSRRGRTEEVAHRIVAVVSKYRRLALEQGVDLTGINPTPDNLAGGLSTIEEKSLGALAKSGSRVIQGVLPYGQRPPGTGLWFMDAPAAAVENLTALAAAGCQAIMFSTGSGNPVGHLLAPTLKVCANPETVERMAEHVDVDLSGGLDATLSLVDCGRKLQVGLWEVCEGRLTAAEKLNYLETNISRIGQSV